MPKTALPNLTPAEWDSVKDYAATLTHYDHKASPIRGKKSLEILQAIQVLVQANQPADVEVALDTLIRRESFNTMVGIEGKSRRKAKARAESAAITTSAA
jgi:hypothetical protein